MSNNAARAAAQLRVAPHADRRGEVWVGDDLAMLQAFTSVPAEELALALGRTVYAVNAARQTDRAGRPAGSQGRARAQAAKARQALPWAPNDPRWG